MGSNLPALFINGVAGLYVLLVAYFILRRLAPETTSAALFHLDRKPAVRRVLTYIGSPYSDPPQPR